MGGDPSGGEARPARTPLVFAVLGAVAATVVAFLPWTEGTRLLIASVLPLSVFGLVRCVVGRRPADVVMAITLVFWLVAWAHVILSGSTARAATEEHAFDWLPPAGVSLAVGTLTTLGWLALLGAAAVSLWRVGAPAPPVALLGVAAVVPLFAPQAFPTDASRLLFEPSAFVHWTYTLSLLCYLVAVGWVLIQPRATPPAPREPGDGPDQGRSIAGWRRLAGPGR